MTDRSTSRWWVLLTVATLLAAMVGYASADELLATGEKVTFTIYTPGSNAGVAMNIVGSLQAPSDVSDAEVIGDEIEGFVSGLLSLVGIVNGIDARAWDPGRDAIARRGARRGRGPG